MDFKDEASRKYCKKVAKRVSEFRRQVVEREGRVDIAFMMFLYNFFVINHIEKAEIDIFFSFVGDLVEPNKRAIYLTETAFAKLFYSILLRLDQHNYTEFVFNSLKNCILFINSHLKIIEVNSRGQIKLLEKQRIIGYEAILNIHIYCDSKKVKAASKELIKDILESKIHGDDLDRETIESDFIAPMVELLNNEYELLSTSQAPAPRIITCLELINSLIAYLRDDVTFTHFGSSSFKSPLSKEFNEGGEDSDKFEKKFTVTIDN